MLNLLATGYATRVLGDLTLLFAPKVASELLYLFTDELRTSKILVDASLLEREGINIERLALTSAEVTLAAQYSAEMDDGEAQTLAVARYRSVAVLSDDNAVARAARRDAAPLISSLDLLHGWADLESTLPAEVVGAAIGMRRRANYAPPRSHALRAWYVGLITTG